MLVPVVKQVLHVKCMTALVSLFGLTTALVRPKKSWVLGGSVRSDGRLLCRGSERKRWLLAHIATRLTRTCCVVLYDDTYLRGGDETVPRTWETMMACMYARASQRTWEKEGKQQCRNTDEDEDGRACPLMGLISSYE